MNNNRGMIMTSRWVRVFQYLTFFALLTLSPVAWGASGWVDIKKDDRYIVTSGLSFYVAYKVTADTTYYWPDIYKIYARIKVEVDGGPSYATYFSGDGD